MSEVAPFPESEQEIYVKDNHREFSLYAFKYCAKACNLWESQEKAADDAQLECLGSFSLLQTVVPLKSLQLENR